MPGKGANKIEINPFKYYEAKNADASKKDDDDCENADDSDGGEDGDGDGDDVVRPPLRASVMDDVEALECRKARQPVRVSPTRDAAPKIHTIHHVKLICI